jgi:hypothetical protein
LHQQQSDRRTKHQPENREPFEQQMSVVGLQTPRSNVRSARKQTFECGVSTAIPKFASGHPGP